jgi:hypothetical protein
MAGKEVGDVSHSAAEISRGPVHGTAQRDLIAANREKILAALIEVAGPDAPPTEEEILGLILGEMAFMQIQRNQTVPPPQRDRASER